MIVDNFLTAHECDELISAAREKLGPSTVSSQVLKKKKARPLAPVRSPYSASPLYGLYALRSARLSLSPVSSLYFPLSCELGPSLLHVGAIFLRYWYISTNTDAEGTIVS
jgi:hypothetical protein